MSQIIREFESIGEFMKTVDEELSNMRRKLGELLRRLEELRVKVEQERKLKSLLTKLGMSQEGSTPSNVIELKTIRLIMNPTAEQEVVALEQAVENLNNKITALQAIKKDLEILGGIDVEVRLTTVYVDGLPRTILIRVV